MEYGRKQKHKIGNIKVDKKIYMPNLERFNKWLEIVETKEWFNEFEFYITGSFINHIKETKHMWPTWDVDIVLTKKEGQIDHQLIKKILLECLGVALIKCSFYMDISYQQKEDIWGIQENQSLNTKEKHIVKYVKFTNRGHKELIQDLWEVHRVFPLQKHINRVNFGFRYEEPLSLSEYREKYYNKKVPV